MNKRNQVLIFIDWFLPAYKAGGPIKSVLNLTNCLSDTHDFYIISSNRDLDETRVVENSILNKWIEKKNYNIKFIKKSSINFSSLNKHMNEKVYDFVYLNSIFSTRFSILPLISGIFLRKKIILAPRGMLAASALSLKFYKKYIFITLFRLFRLHELIIWHATDEIEVNDIKNTFGKKCFIKLSPNIPSDTNIKYIPKAKKKNHLDIFFLSRISKKKNLDYALKVLNSISDKYKITFSIIGPIDDDNYWEYCHNRFIKISNHKIEYLGPVKPEILPKIISSKHLLFLPTLNENYGHVIVESWQNSCPVLISNNTPWKGLDKKRVGFDISLKDHYSFSEKIISFLNMDQIEFNLWSESSYLYSKKIYDKKNLKKLAKLLFK